MAEPTKTTLDVAAVRKDIVQHLKDHGFLPRDGDGADFQFGTDPGLRFKVGTVYGEVTITIWTYGRQIRQPIRILTEAQAVEAKYEVDAVIAEFFAKRRP